jgi:signal transduction histidine kinase
MATTMQRSGTEQYAAPPQNGRGVLTRWHALRRTSLSVGTGVGAALTAVLASPSVALATLLIAGLAVDAHIAIRTQRKSVAPTVLVDITIAGIACIAAGVPPVGISMVTAYFVVLVAVVGRSMRSWWIGLYAIVVGSIVTMAPVLFDLPEPTTARTIVVGVAAVAVSSYAMLEIIRQFVISLRQRSEDEERRVDVSNAISTASRALVAQDDARALAFAVDAIRDALRTPILFVEQNIEETDGGIAAVVVEISSASDVVHPTYERGSRTSWVAMPRARSHLEGGAPFFYRIEEASGSSLDRTGDGGVRHEVNVPISVNGSWVGVIGAADTDADKVWRTDDLVLLRTLADLTAAFWQRVEDMRVRDSLIGSLDGRLRYEEALARSSTSLLGDRGVDIDSALDAIGAAARVDEVYITRTIAKDDGSPSALWIASWTQPGLGHIRPVDTEISYTEMPAVVEAIHQGSLARLMDGTNSELVIGIEVSGGWFGTVGFLRRKASRSWSKRDVAFLRTIGEILGAHYERSQNRARLEDLLSSKDQLIASVSHELRTPLTAVVGLAEELQADDGSIGDEERQQLIGVVATESREMADLVDDLLVAARSTDGTVPVFPERTDLSLLAASVASHLAIPSDVAVVIDDDASAAYADPVRVRQVIRNLLTNALRYGGKNVRVTFGEDGEMAFLDVTDDGAGIPALQLDKIFEPYGRGSTDHIVPGSVGLGLTLSKRLAELMGGSLSYEPSGGCTFRLSLPSARAAAKLQIPS